MAADQPSGVSSGFTNAYEAWYGDKSGALALLKFPPALHDFFLRLSDKADLPDSPPAGAAWAPFVRGWKQDNYYVVTLTKPDHKSARPGMVATRIIAIPLMDVTSLDSLSDVFIYLQ